MQSTNPMLTRAGFEVSTNPMTIRGAVNKSAILTAFAAISALGFYLYCMNVTGNNPARLGMMIGGISAFVLSLIMIFKNNTAPTLALPLALMEGLFMGGISFMYQASFPGVPLTAIAATFVTAIVLFGLYRAGIIRATEKFKSVVISATIAIALLGVVQMIMSLAFNSTIPFLYGMGPIGIAFAGFVCVIASLNLILDFDLIERSAQLGAPKNFEWVCAASVLITLVWMYVSFMRLIAAITSSD